MRVRDVVLADSPAISEVHAGSEGPWVDPTECAVWVNHRLRRPFVCRVAERDGRVVGHAEWIVGREPGLAEPYLYLGMLQVRPDVRGTGAGRRLVEDGVELARARGCDRIRTIPEEDVVGFYERCGLRVTATIRGHRRAVAEESLEGWLAVRSAPLRVARELPMRLGWSQACSRHMWEICRRWPVAGERWWHPCVRTEDGAAWVLLRYHDRKDALVVAWARPDVPLRTLADAAAALAARRGIGELLLLVRPGERLRVAGLEPDGETPVMERPVEAWGRRTR